jgi:sulfate adenylyltransferase subunit 1 (EFTu-like GTPase family)
MDESERRVVKKVADDLEKLGHDTKRAVEDFQKEMFPKIEDAMGASFMDGITYCCAIIELLTNDMEKHVAESPGHGNMSLYTRALDDAYRMIQNHIPEKMKQKADRYEQTSRSSKL